MSKNELIFLWGMPGVGKSSMGKKIAKLLEWNWIDLDLYIENKYNCSITEMVALNGSDFFRKAEQDCLLEMIQLKHTVVSCGGGTPVYFENANTMLESGTCVYLNAELSFIYSRLIQSNQERFMFKQDQTESWKTQLEMVYKDRKPIYELAPIQVKIPETPIAQIILEVKRGFEKS